MDYKVCEACNKKLALINFKKERNICLYCWSRGIKSKEDIKPTSKQLKYQTKVDNSVSCLIPKVTNLISSNIAHLPGIYKITNTKLNKYYIGQSSDLHNRCDNYKLLKGYINFQLKEDLKTYKPKYFTFEVLEYLPDSSEEYRLDREAYYKAQYQPSELYNKIVGKEDKAGYQNYLDSKGQL